MRKTKMTVLMKSVACKCRRLLAQKKSSIQFSLPYAFSGLYCHDRRLERLLCRLARRASLKMHPGNIIRIAVRRRNRMRDLEKFFQIQPAHWIQLRIAWCGPAGFERDALEMMRGLGYRCEEWIGENGSWPQLGAFSFGTKRLLKFLFWTQRRKAIQKCDLLIPVMEPEQQ